jgi:glycerophosphoryl diester phosphodiesterase
VQEDAAARCVVASEHREALLAFDESPFARGASAPEISALYWVALLRRRPPAPGYRMLSVPLRHRGLPVPTSGFVAAARAHGCAVHVWTVDSPDTARRLWRRGVSGIVTNVPGTMVEARRTEMGA